MRKLVGFLAFSLVALGCGAERPDTFYAPDIESEEPPPPPRPEAFATASWDELDLGELDSPEVREAMASACRNSISWLEGPNAPATIHYGPRDLTPAEAVAGHRGFLSLLGEYRNTATFRAALAERFTLMRSVGRPSGKTLFTGYYVESLEGSLTPVKGYTPAYGIPPELVEVIVADFAQSREGDTLFGTLRRVPERGLHVIDPLTPPLPPTALLYGKGIVRVNVKRFGDNPKTIRGQMDGSELVPYWTRAQIRSEGRLAGRGLEVAWIKNPVDLFFTEIQGTGILHLPDGTRATLHYATQNGHKYRAIGRLLRDEGHLPPDGVTMQSIYAWLMRNPHEQQRVMNYNESFIFFEVTSGSAQGYAGLTLTPRHSFAADLDYFPRAGLGFIDLPHPALNPDGTVTESGRVSRFGFFQDTGGAIKGPGRIDIFWGDDAAAKQLAGFTQHEGNTYILVPR